MKKFISAIAALSVCAVMLAGCGGNGSTADLQDETTPAPAVTTTAAETKGQTEEASGTKQEEADTETEPEEEIVDDGNEAPEETDSGDAKLEFASLEEFAEYDISSLPYEKISSEDSNTYELVKTFEDAEGFYLDVEALNGTMSIAMAFQDKNLAMDAVDETGNRVLTLITNYTLYIFDPASMTCYYFVADESIFDAYNTDEILSQIDIDESKIAQAEEIGSCKVNIGGTDYLFEYSDNSGFLYDMNGKVNALISNNPSVDVNAFIVNGFSGHVPDGYFDIPDGYEMIDFSSIFSMGE